jgi:hypothetical protein
MEAPKLQLRENVTSREKSEMHGTDQNGDADI